MIRLVAILLAAATLGGCASYCERAGASLAQPDDRYGGIATAQGGCARSAAPVSQARLRESLA